jgi:hypothetical protein
MKGLMKALSLYKLQPRLSIEYNPTFKKCKITGK